MAKIHRFEAKLRGFATKQERNASIVEQFRGGKPIKAIAADFHMTQNAIYIMLKRMGVSVKAVNASLRDRRQQEVAEYYSNNKEWGNSAEIALKLGLGVSTMRKWIYEHNLKTKTI